jgi:hypothetical protein
MNVTSQHFKEISSALRVVYTTVINSLVVVEAKEPYSKHEDEQEQEMGREQGQDLPQQTPPKSESK